MKILLIQNNGIHDGNREFRETWVLKNSFEKLGHYTVLWGKYHSNFNNIPDFNSFDIILNLENYDDEWLPDLSNVTKPYKIFYAMDSHARGLAPYEKIVKDSNYNLMLCGIKNHAVGKNKAWWPLGIACDNSLFYKNSNIIKNEFLGFVGNYANNTRAYLLHLLEDYFSLKKYIFVIGKTMVDLINSFHIHFNYTISDSCNARIFETISCGSVLLTNNNCELQDLGFETEKNCLIYNSIDELKDKIVYYKNNLTLLENIANNGHTLSRKHNSDVRVKSLLNYLETKI